MKGVITIFTYQDLLTKQTDKERKDFVLACVNEHRNSKEYKNAKIADDYYRRQNTTIVNYQNLLYTLEGKAVPDNYSANYKLCSGFFRIFTTQKVQYLLGNGVNWQYMRLADVYLMAAEAENELGNTSTAWTYMKPVLDRVLPAAKVSALQAKYTASQTAFREGIYEQRALEFAGEALRKPDLIRWGNIDTKMAEAKAKLTALANRTGAYEGLPDKVFLYPSIDANDIRIYGLNKGEDDADHIATLNAEGWESKNWFISNSANALTQDYIDGLYVVQPSTHCIWPIWRCFIDTSNNQLDNEGIYGQLSD